MSSALHRLFLYKGPTTHLGKHGHTRTGEVIALTPQQAQYVTHHNDENFVDTGEVTDSATERHTPEQAKEKWPDLFTERPLQSASNKQENAETGVVTDNRLEADIAGNDDDKVIKEHRNVGGEGVGDGDDTGRGSTGGDADGDHDADAKD
jgi:hypothetical protein